MNNNTARWWRRGAAATTVGLVAAVVAAYPAAAAPILPPTGDSTLVIHKSSNAPGIAGDGTELGVDPTVGYELEGVGFTIWRVTYDSDPIDLNTNEGWTLAAQLAAGMPALVSADTYATAEAKIDDVTDFSLVPDVQAADLSYTGLTDVDGLLQFAGIPNSLYLVIETTPPDGAVAPTKPFLVTLPITDPVDSDTWLSTVHVYPKNEVTSLTKTVSDVDAVIAGDPITYTVTALTPVFDVSALVITDTLDAKLDYVASSLVVTVPDDIVAVDGDTDPDVLTPVTDYTLDTTGDVITVTFTATGLDIVNDDLAEGDPITVTFDAVANAAGEIPNTAYIQYNGGTAIPSSTNPETKWGQIALTKTNAVPAPLAGATFAVFDFEPDAAQAADYLNQAIDFNGATAGGIAFTTDVNGEILFPILRYSDFADNDDLIDGDPGYRPYYVVEVEAPAGYELLATPVEVILNEEAEVLDIVDVPLLAGFTLPFTGGAGTAVFYLVGGGLIALTVILFVVFGARRRKEHEQY